MKRKFPVAVWQTIQPIIDQYRHLVIPLASEQHALWLKDATPGSDFYFHCDPIKDSPQYRIEHVPYNISSNQLSRQNIELQDLGKWLDQWFKALDAYDTMPTVYDDPILKSYEAEFAASFQMQDEEADKAPFDVEKQLALDEYLTSIKGLLETRKEAATSPEQKEEIGAIIAECTSLQEEMTKLTKNQTVQRLSKIWAKGRKAGIGVMKELLTEFKKESYKVIVKKAIDYAPTIINILGALAEG